MIVGNVFWLKRIQLNKVIFCRYINKSMDDMKSMVSWVLACRASKDSPSRWSNIEVTLLVLQYLLVTYLAAHCCTICYFADILLGVGAPDCLAVMRVPQQPYR